MVENSITRLEKQAKTRKELVPHLECLIKIRNHLDQNRPVRTLSLNEEEKIVLSQYSFLTAKKVLDAANVSEKDLPEMNNKYVQLVREYAQAEGNHIIPICARLEEEIAQLIPEERKPFLESLNLHESGLERLIKTSFSMLGLITFFRQPGKWKHEPGRLPIKRQQQKLQAKSIRIFKRDLFEQKLSL